MEENNVMLGFREKLHRVLEKVELSLKTNEGKKAFKRGCYLAGGAVWSIFHNETPNDYDIFCRSKEDMDAVLKDLGEPNHTSDNACTYIFDDLSSYQFVIYTFGEPDKVIEQFDFKHNMFALDYKSEFFYKDLVPLLTRELVVNPLNTGDLNLVICRVVKFCERGFTFQPENMAELLLMLQKQGGIKENILHNYIVTHGDYINEHKKS